MQKTKTVRCNNIVAVEDITDQVVVAVAVAEDKYEKLIIPLTFDKIIQ